jgi:arginine/ornithine N-succinyltransferase beta subunit
MKNSSLSCWDKIFLKEKEKAVTGRVHSDLKEIAEFLKEEGVKKF